MNGGIDFRLAGVPVRVLWMFFLVSLLLGFNLQDPVLIAMWIGVVFVSILAHEMGHAVAYRRFGVQPSIVLHGFGGLTFGRSLPVGRDLVVSLAGPFTGLAIGLPLLYVDRNVFIANDTLSVLVGMAVYVNVFWSLVNLVPLLPLDGGNAANAVLSLVFRRDMTHAARILSIVTAGVLIVVALRWQFIYGALLAGYFLYMNVQALRSTSRPFVAGPATARPTPGQFVPPRPPRNPAPAPAPAAADGITGPAGSPPAPEPRPPLEPGAAAYPPHPPAAPDPAPIAGPVADLGRPGPPSAPPLVPPVPPAAAPVAGAPTSPPSAAPTPTPAAVSSAARGRAPRTFAHEIDVAARALTRDEPELATIALDRARRLATTADEHTVLAHLQTEVDQRLRDR